MRIHFGMLSDRAPWVARQSRLNEVTAGPLTMARLLQTRLGLTRPETTHTHRIGQYLLRLQRIDSPSSWAHGSLAVDPWATARSLLADRDLLVSHGWDGAAPPRASERLATLAAAEAAPGELEPALADDVRELRALLPGGFPLGIEEVVLRHARSAFPAIWRDILDRLEAGGAAVVEAPAPAGPMPELTVLEADTEWEAAEHAARWLAAGTGRRATAAAAPEDPTAAGPEEPTTAAGAPGTRTTAVAASAPTAVLDHALARLGLPRLGVSERSPWHPQDQIVPLFLETLWSPADVALLGELLALPISPVRRAAGRRLLAALADEPGLGGQAWDQALEDIARGDTSGHHPGLEEPDPQLAEDLDRLFHRGLFPADRPASTAALVEAAQWLEDRLRARRFAHPELQRTLDELGELRGLLAATPEATRQEVRRLAALTASGARSPLASPEAAPWTRLERLDQLAAPVDDVLWWGFDQATVPTPRRFDPSDVAALAAAGTHLPDPADTARLAVGQTLAGARRAGRLLVVRPLTLNGEPVEGNPLLEALAAELPGDEPVGRRLAARTVRAADLAGPDWRLAGRAARLEPVPGAAVARPAPRLSAPRSGPLELRPLSHTQLSTLLGCSLAWALEKLGRLRVPSEDAPPEGNRLLGLLAHKVVELVHGELAAAHRAVPTEEEVGDVLDRILPIHASELLLPGRAAQRAAVRATIARNTVLFFAALQRAGIRFTASEQGFEVPLELDLGGRRVETTLRGFADVVGRDEEDRPVVVDLKWTNSGRYFRRAIEEGTAVQLALYQWALARAAGRADAGTEGDGVGSGADDGGARAGAAPADGADGADGVGPAAGGPRTAYFLLKQGEFATADPVFGPAVEEPAGAGQLWEHAVATAAERLAAIAAGDVGADPLERAAERAASGEREDAQHARLVAELRAAGRFHGGDPCRFCDLQRLCGLKGDYS